jgi:hypothetical protein
MRRSAYCAFLKTMQVPPCSPLWLIKKKKKKKKTPVPYLVAGGALWPALSCLTGLHGSTVKKVVVGLSHVSRLMRTKWFSFPGKFTLNSHN